MIDFKNVYKKFGKKEVLLGASLTIETGESVTIIGRSGTGKSVLLKHIVGLIRPDSGSILVDGTNVVTANLKKLYAVRKKFGMLFQGAALFDSMTVEENISLALRMHTKMSNGEIEKRVAECLDMVNMSGTEKLKPAELSGGMRKRIGLARAIAMNPEYILYDEPTTGLDPITADTINDLIIRLNDELKVTTIVVTHDMVSAYKISTRIVMLHEGGVFWSGTPEETQKTEIDIVRRFVTGDADEDQKVIVSY